MMKISVRKCAGMLLAVLLAVSVLSFAIISPWQHLRNNSILLILCNRNITK